MHLPRTPSLYCGCGRAATHRSFKNRKWSFRECGWTDKDGLARLENFCGSCARKQRADGDDTLVTHYALWQQIGKCEERVSYWKNGRNLFRSTTQEWHAYRTWYDRMDWAYRRATGIDFEMQADKAEAKRNG